MREYKLYELCNLITCGVAKKPDYFDSGVPFLSSRNIKTNRIILNDYRFISKKDHDELTKKNKPEKGDILYTRVGSFGEAAINTLDFEFSIFVSLTLIKPKHDLLNSKYLMYFLNSRETQELAKRSTTGSGVQNLNVSTVRNFRIPLPPLNDQIRIAEILTQAEKLIEQRKKSIELLDEFIQASFLHIFGDPLLNDKKWKEIDLKKCTTKIGSGSTPKGGKLIYQKTGISLIRSLNVYDNEFKYKNLAFISESQAEKLKNVEVKSNDVLFNITGGSVCRCTVVPDDVLPARVNQHVSILRPIPEILNSKFLSILLITKNIKSKLLGIGSYGGAVMQAITKEELQNFKIPIPPIEVQNQFDNIVSRAESLKADYQSSLIELENMYEVLSQKAFKGELKIDDFRVVENIGEVLSYTSQKREDEILEIIDSSTKSNNEKHLYEMPLDQYYNIPKEIISKYGNIENINEDWEYLLKKIFKNTPIDLNHLQEVYNQITYERANSFVFEDWKNFIFNELSKSKSFLKQKYNSKTNQIELLIK